MDYQARVRKLRNKLNEKVLDSFLTVNPENVLYLSGLFSSNAVFLLLDDCAYILTDNRYFARAEELGFAEPVLIKEGITKSLKSLLKQNHKELAVEESLVNHSFYKELASLAPLSDAGLPVDEIRQVKDQEEITYLRKAGSIAAKSHNQLLISSAPGKTEKQLAAQLDCLMIENGADAPAFETIVASGPNCAVPHHETGERKIEKGDFLLIDAGAKVGHYHSDLSRTTIVGEPEPRQEAMLRLASEAQEKAMRAIGIGKKMKDVDNIARSLLSAEGYGENFTHGLGHGVGLAVHEKPVLNPKSETLVREGMVFTIEPGIYIEGYGGVRVEDTVLVKKDGIEILTKNI